MVVTYTLRVGNCTGSTIRDFYCSIRVKFKMGELHAETIRYVEDGDYLCRGFHPEEWNYFEIPFWDDIISIQDTQEVNDERIKSHAAALQVHAAAQLSIKATDLGIEPPKIPVLQWTSCHDAVYTVYVPCDKKVPQIFNLAESPGGRKALTVELKELAPSDKNIVRILGLGKNDYDARGDRTFNNESSSRPKKRGGLTYNQPGEGWVRVAYNVKAYGDDTDWMDRDNGWAVGFHGCRELGIENLLNVSKTRKLFPGLAQAYETSKNVNELSDSYGKDCGKGIYFADDIEEAAEFYGTEILGYKCVFQVRLNPQKVKIPEKRRDYLIVEDPEDVRVYGICFKKKCEEEQFSDQE